MADSQSPQRSLLIKLLDDAYNKSGWHGPNLRGALRRVTPQQSVRRPKPKRRNIAEIVLHCAYWKYTVRRRITGGKRGSFVLKGSNWFDVPTCLSKTQWAEYKQLLDAEHDALREAIAGASWSLLCRTAKGPTEGPAGHIYGIAMHDTYHAGQIQTIKALYKEEK